MFFKKKEKAVASEAIQEDGQRTEVPVGVDAQLSIKPVRKRRQRIKEEMELNIDGKMDSEQYMCK